MKIPKLKDESYQYCHSCIYPSIIKTLIVKGNKYIDTDCPSPLTLESATIQENADLINRTLGSKITYICDEGFEFSEVVSSRQYLCNDTKEWTPTNESLPAEQALQGCKRKCSEEV